MRLVAVYFHEKILEHVFGKDHSGQSINLGGKFIYSFTKKSKGLELNLKEKNPDFIPEFWGESLSLISAIVGANGVGKTSILRAINHKADRRYKPIIQIYESDETEDKRKVLYVENNSGIKLDFDNGKKFLLKEIDPKENLVQKLYYSPVIDFDLIDTKSPIALVNKFDHTLNDYFLETVSRNVRFLKDPVILTLQDVYEDFPSYDLLWITPKAHRKDDFTNIYAQANFATPHKGEVLKHEINRDLGKINDNSKFDYSNSQLRKLLEHYKNLLVSESFIDQFYKLWETEIYKANNDQNLIHNNDDFLKNTEISLLSYLLLGAVFPQTGLGTSFDFKKILKADHFEDKLNLFLEFYLINRIEVLYDKIKNDLNGIKIEDAEKIIQIIKNDKFTKLSGVDIIAIKKRMIRDVEGFFDIWNFHKWLSNYIGSGILKIEDNNILFDFESLDEKLFDEFLAHYNRLLQYFSSWPIEFSLFEIRPNKKLSSGEKALLSFYSSLYDYIKRTANRKDFQFENYLLLLDEPELGYHPLWKKKFVQAIVKTLPVLFRYLTHKNKSPKLQVVFSTHDPLTLSDLPNENIIYLNNPDGEKTIIEDKMSKKSFGANVADLLADSFFIKNGLMGDFSKEKIDTTISWLQSKENDNPKYHSGVINLIDEPLIKKKLLEMYDRKMETDYHRKFRQNELKSLIKRYRDEFGTEL